MVNGYLRASCGVLSTPTTPLRARCSQETVHAALFSATAALPRVCSAMSLYLDNKATEGILLHPVQRRVVDAVDIVRDLLQRLHPAEVSVRLLVDAAVTWRICAHGID